MRPETGCCCCCCCHAAGAAAAVSLLPLPLSLLPTLLLTLLVLTVAPALVPPSHGTKLQSTAALLLALAPVASRNATFERPRSPSAQSGQMSTTITRLQPRAPQTLAHLPQAPLNSVGLTAAKL